ncbi:MAG: 4'-phosphopantetheinyl transferase superfamily protein [Bacteroidota bacterium]
MAFIALCSQIPDVKIGAWKIEEDELYFLERVKLYENEWKRLANIQHPQKRLEWLSSRLCLKELLKISNQVRVESLNASSGKPYLSTLSHRISYTHSNKYSAAIASLDYEVGVDIEYRHRKRNQRTRYLFMNEAEMKRFEEKPSMEHFLMVWSAKETLYKIHGEGTSFKEDLHIHMDKFPLEPNGILPATVKTDDWTKDYEIHYVLHTDFILTYTAAKLY